MAREFNLNPTEEMLQAASSWISDHSTHFGIETQKKKRLVLRDGIGKSSVLKAVKKPAFD
jgi:hypothetical protein